MDAGHAVLVVVLVFALLGWTDSWRSMKAAEDRAAEAQAAVQKARNLAAERQGEVEKCEEQLRNHLARNTKLLEECREREENAVELSHQRYHERNEMARFFRTQMGLAFACLDSYDKVAIAHLRTTIDKVLGYDAAQDSYRGQPIWLSLADEQNKATDKALKESDMGEMPVEGERDSGSGEPESAESGT